MKKRGFTLIELIAVIVVLAIIALIATPKIVRVIKDARREAIERSAERYLDAVETAVANDKLKENNVIDGVYEVNKEGNLVIEGHEPLIVETSGDKPKEGSKVAIQNGQVISLGTNMTIGKYAVTIDDKGIATATSNKSSTTLLTFSEACYLVSGPEKQVGSKYMCYFGGAYFETFYVLETGSNKVSNSKLKDNEIALIYEDSKGSGKRGSWCSDDYYDTDVSCGVDGLTAYLDGMIKNYWPKLDITQVSVPSVEQIRGADGSTTGEITTEWVYFIEFSDENMPPYGYYTSTIVSQDDEKVVVYIMGRTGSFFPGILGERDSYYGHSFYTIRPVVTLPI